MACIPLHLFANTIAPTAYFWHGVLPLTLGMALPASVLAAVLERPFVTAAGVRDHALWFSLQANGGEAKNDGQADAADHG